MSFSFGLVPVRVVSYDAMNNLPSKRCDWPVIRHKQWLVFKKTKQSIFIGWSIHSVVKKRSSKMGDPVYKQIWSLQNWLSSHKPKSVSDETFSKMYLKLYMYIINKPSTALFKIYRKSATVCNSVARERGEGSRV